MKARALLENLEPYVPGKSVAGGVKLSSNENPLGASPRAMAAITAALNLPSSDPSSLNRYPDGGMTLLRQALARYWEVDTDMLMAGNGSDEIFVMIAGAFMDPGCNAITGSNTFSQYTFATTIFGGQMRYARMPGGEFDLPAIDELIDDDTRVIFLCNPNNPTATIFSHDALTSFLGGVPDHVVVVVDEAYGEFADSPDYPRTMDLIRRYPNLIRLRTFSKIFGLAALRVGYATAQPSLISTIAKLRQPFNVGTIAQVAAAAALEDREFFDYSIRNNLAGRDRVCATLRDLGIDFYPSQANFVCAHLPSPEGDGKRSSKLVANLAERGLSVRPLHSFGIPDHVRLSIGTPDEISSLCDALRDLVTAGRGNPT